MLNIVQKVSDNGKSIVDIGIMLEHNHVIKIKYD